MDYSAVPGINWSSLKHLSVSPKLYQWRLTHPEPSKPAYVLGSAIHCAILEPDVFYQRYAVFDGVRRGKAWEEWQAEHPGVQSLKPDELEHVRHVAAAVRWDRVAGPLVRGGRFEEVVTWFDAATGLPCKGRVDYIRPEVVIDLKSTRDPRPQKFERAAADYGYPGQLAFYHDGAVAAKLIDGRARPYIIAPQSGEPYDVAVFQLKEETLEYGRLLYRSLLHRLLECTEAGFWPGVAPDLQELGISPWAPEPLAVNMEEDF